MRVAIFPSGLATLVVTASALGQQAIVTTNSSQASNLFQLAGINDGQILLSADEWWGVLRVAQDLAGDFGKVTGMNLTLGNWMSSNPTNSTATKRTKSHRRVGTKDWGGPVPASAEHEVIQTNSTGTTVLYTYEPITSFVSYNTGLRQSFTGPILSDFVANTVIIAGTVGKSSVITQLVSSGKLDTSEIQGVWEGFISQVIESPLPGVERALVIAGADQRGTIYGLYDISEQIGISPWWWWADVPVKKSSGIWAMRGKKVQGSPSVKYRGIFINDEQPALTNWINENYVPGKYGAGFNHFFYPTVFELLLRLRANYLWPAMWGSMFEVDDTANQPLADAYGIVMGTSHTEPMMRATNEWSIFGTQYGGNGQWAFNTNNKSIIPFLTIGTKRAKPYAASSLFTMAMRGSGDTGITLSDADAVLLLEQVVEAQRAILGEVFGNDTVKDIPQMWCLYKEVQGYYEQLGLTVPDDITLLWSDDNWGNTRRLPLANETSRSGGAGVYYHVDYVGDPRNYKWINTIQLSKTVEQMNLAYARQADRIWILNVGDLKPLEIPINHFLDLAYDTPSMGYDSVSTWLTMWATREFNFKIAPAVASIMERYSMYAARRKYELLDPSFYSVINYNEADANLAQWSSLADDAQSLYDELDAENQAAFYEMILQPVLGGQVIQQIYIEAAKNTLYVQQKRSSANSMAMQVLKTFNEDHVLTQRYHELMDGKWNHILDQTHLGYQNYWQQPMRNTAPPITWVQDLETSLAGNIGIGIEASNATVSGDDAYHTNSGNTLVLPPLDPYGPKTRWIDVFSRGTAGCQWTLSPWSSYVQLSSSTGTTGGNNGSDTRVYVSIDWSHALSVVNSTTNAININVTSSCASAWGNYPSPTIQVPVSNPSVPSDFIGFVESDKHITIEAEHFSRNSSSGSISYAVLPSHGRTLSGVTLMPVLAATQPAGTGPVLEYDIYTFTNTTKANLTLLLSPSLNQNGASRPLKYGVSFDDEPIQTIHPVGNYTGANMPAGWLGAVSDNIWGMSSGNSTTTRHDLSKTGKHTLRIWAVEPGLVIQKIILDLGGVRYSYLGPPESFMMGRDTVGVFDGTNFAGVEVKNVI